VGKALSTDPESIIEEIYCSETNVAIPKERIAAFRLSNFDGVGGYSLLLKFAE
jgi:hypothetical protein